MPVRVPRIFVLPLLLLPTFALAQPALDLNQLALRWTLGDYASPLVCEVHGQPARGLRSIGVEPGPSHVRPPVNRLRFLDLEVPADTHCYLDTGGEQPNVVGSLTYLLPSISRPDIANHDFETIMRKEHGFDFEIRSGRLRIGPDEDEGRFVDFKGGTARFRAVLRGTDSHRRLLDLPSRRKLHLVVTAKDGTRLEFDLAARDEGPAPPR